MVATGRAREIFADARALRDDALDMLAQGLLRNAAEKAWGAAKRATDAWSNPGCQHTRNTMQTRTRKMT